MQQQRVRRPRPTHELAHGLALRRWGHGPIVVA